MHLLSKPHCSPALSFPRTKNAEFLARQARDKHIWESNGKHAQILRNVLTVVPPIIWAAAFRLGAGGVSAHRQVPEARHGAQVGCVVLD
eukprot:COSAG06_NODE_24324_length_666_cov_0.952381_1_plen_88_part_01